MRRRMVKVGLPPHERTEKTKRTMMIHQTPARWEVIYTPIAWFRLWQAPCHTAHLTNTKAVM